MRLLTLLLLCVTLTGHAQELPVYKGEILRRDGLSYKPFSNGPLTAKVEQYYDSGQLKALYTVIDGKKEGLTRYWHENGELEGQITYVNGEGEGLEKAWHENGQLYYEIPRVNGLAEGLLKFWKPDGDASSSCYKAGRSVDMSYCTKGK